VKVAEQVHLLKVPFAGIFTAVYLVVNDKVGLVDSGLRSSPEDYILPYLTGLGRTPAAISLVVLTHWHGDHVEGAQALQRQAGAKIAIHELGVRGLQAPSIEQVETYGDCMTEDERRMALKGPRQVGIVPDLALREGEVVTLGDLQFQVLHTPGHVAGSISLWNSERGILFTGDSVQAWGPMQNGGPFYCDAEGYLRSLQAVRDLQPKLVLAAHPYRPFSESVHKDEDALRFIGESTACTKAIDDQVLSSLTSVSQPLSLGDVAKRVAAKLAFGQSTFTTRVTVNAHRKRLLAEGAVEQIVDDMGAYWRAR